MGFNVINIGRFNTGIGNRLSNKRFLRRAMRRRQTITVTIVIDG